MESKEALELCSVGKNEKWRAGDRAPWPGEHPKRAWSACHRHSPSTPKPDGSGTFSISTKRLQSLTKVYHPQVHLFVDLQELPDSLEQKTSGSPNLALTVLCGCCGGREPLANFLFLPIHFLFSWQVTLTWTLNAQLGKIGLLGDGSRLCEHEPWLGVTFFEQPGKTSLGSHSTMPPWTQLLGIKTHHASCPAHGLTPSGQLFVLTPLHSSDLLAASSRWYGRVAGKEGKQRPKRKETESSYSVLRSEDLRETDLPPKTHLGNFPYHSSHNWNRIVFTHHHSSCLPPSQKATRSFSCSEIFTRISLVIQLLRICLPTQGTQVQSREDPTFYRATKPGHPNYWVRLPGSHAPQWEAHAPQLEDRPCSPWLEKAHIQQWRSRADKKSLYQFPHPLELCPSKDDKMIFFWQDDFFFFTWLRTRWLLSKNNNFYFNNFMFSCEN